jgi:hypothetical protein
MVEVDKKETVPDPFNWPLDLTTLTILVVSLLIAAKEIIEFHKLQLKPSNFFHSK